MKNIFKKYEFDSQDQAETRIAALPSVQDEEGNNVPSHKHTVVKLGYIWTVQPVYDEDGNIETEGEQSSKYSVDVLWNAAELTQVDEEAVLDDEGMVVTPAVTSISYPYGWLSKEIEVEGNGVHTFAGWSFNTVAEVE
jgi:hypothetical protein